MSDERSPHRVERGARLREARMRVFPSAAEAARALSMKAVTLRAHESGQNDIGWPELERYARRYGVNVGWLVAGTGGIEPSTKDFQEAGELISVFGTVQDGVWLPFTIEEWRDGKDQPLTSGGFGQDAVYSDPRFPAEMVRPMQLISRKQNDFYDGDTILFTVPAVDVEPRPGDHVVVLLERNGFVQVSLRRMELTAGGFEYHAITSDDPVLSTAKLPEGVTEEEVIALVVGASIRRKVNLPSAALLRRADLPEE